MQSNFNISIPIVAILNNQSRCQFPCEITVRTSFLHFCHTLQFSTNNEKSCSSYEFMLLLRFIFYFFKLHYRVIKSQSLCRKQALGHQKQQWRHPALPRPAADALPRTLAPLSKPRRSPHRAAGRHGKSIYRKRNVGFPITFPEKLSNTSKVTENSVSGNAKTSAKYLLSS